MTHRDIGFNWRATMGNATALPADVADYLDMIADLTKDDIMYRHTAMRHTCAHDDPIVLLDNVRREGLCITLADHKLYDRAVAGVRQHRSTFYCDAEIERRMKEADGACPMCGFELVFHEGDYGKDSLQPMMMRCQHNPGHHVHKDMIHAYKHRRSSWQGRNWPWSYMEGKPIPVKDGEPLIKDDNSSRTPCPGCNEMEACEKMEAALFKLEASVVGDDFRKNGWSSPVAAYRCTAGEAVDCANKCGEGTACNHTYMRVKGDIRRCLGTFGYASEIRLNGAGLKLYIKAPTAGWGRQVSFGMRVGGDQVRDYAGFQEHAHRIFTECGVPSETA